MMRCAVCNRRLSIVLHLTDAGQPVGPVCASKQVGMGGQMALGLGAPCRTAKRRSNRGDGVPVVRDSRTLDLFEVV